MRDKQFRSSTNDVILDLGKPLNKGRRKCESMIVPQPLTAMLPTLVRRAPLRISTALRYRRVAQQQYSTGKYVLLLCVCDV